MRRNGHDPIDRGEAHPEHVKEDAGAAQHLQIATDSAVLPVDVLLFGPTVENQHEREPDAEINYGASNKRRGGQIPFLKITQRALTGEWSVEPSDINVLHT